MRVLVDTHVFLWFATDDSQLSQKARRLFLDSQVKLYLSMVSVWEMAIKIKLGKLKLPTTLEEFLEYPLQEQVVYLLPIELEHTLQTIRLPLYHRDPFDRLLVAQAIHEDLILLSHDNLLDKYPVKRMY